MFQYFPLFMFRRYLFLGLRSKPAPLADDERPIPSGARMCGEFINPLHYYCNLQQFLVSSMVGGDANGPYFRWSGRRPPQWGSILPDPLPLNGCDSLYCRGIY